MAAGAAAGLAAAPGNHPSIFAGLIMGPALQTRLKGQKQTAADLPALAPLFARRPLRLPLLAWTVRSDAERHHALRWADQIIFEGFRP